MLIYGNYITIVERVQREGGSSWSTLSILNLSISIQDIFIHHKNSFSQFTPQYHKDPTKTSMAYNAHNVKMSFFNRHRNDYLLFKNE